MLLREGQLLFNLELKLADLLLELLLLLENLLDTLLELSRSRGRRWTLGGAGGVGRSQDLLLQLLKLRHILLKRSQLRLVLQGVLLQGGQSGLVLLLQMPLLHHLLLKVLVQLLELLKLLELLQLLKLLALLLLLLLGSVGRDLPVLLLLRCRL